MSTAVDPITTNTAFVFIKPHACTSAVEDLVKETLIRQKLRIVNDGYMTCEQIDEEGIIDRHYSVIAKYAMAKSIASDNLMQNLSTAGEQQFTAKFGVDWRTAVEKGTLVTAKQALVSLGWTAAQLNRAWTLSSVKAKLMPGLYVGLINTELPQEKKNASGDEDSTAASNEATESFSSHSAVQLIVVNGFYPINREKFTTAGKRIHWYVVSWDESDIDWRQFRANIIGTTNPADAAEGSIRSTILRDWQILSLADQPNVSDNGVHASAGPIEGLQERMVWLHATIRDDYFANSLLLHGVSATILERVLKNPVITLRNREGLAFDLLEDAQSSDVVTLLKEYDDACRLEPLRNHAFVFIKPHAVSHSTKALVEACFALRDIRVDFEGEITSEVIGARGIVDKHYSALARYALEWRPFQIVLDEAAQAAFENKFHVTWSSALAKGRVFNAWDAGKELGDISAKDLWVLWSAHEKRLKLAPGLYVTYFDEQNMYVINGFYLYNREKLTLRGKKIAWMCVSWEESLLSWKDFRSLVIGATNPADAPEGSVRREILSKWKDLGLGEPPNTSDNGVHASAGPLEGLVERHVWLGSRMESDVLAVAAAKRGASSAFLLQWSRNPVVTIDGRRGAAFDLLEDLNSSDVIRLLKAAEALEKNKVTENTALVFIKPHAVTNGTIELVTTHCKQQGFRILREGSLPAEAIDAGNIIDRHYSVISNYAMHAAPNALQLHPTALDIFYNKYHLRWEDVVHDGRVANARDACLQLGNISATELQRRWSDEADKIRLGPGLYVGFLPSSATFVINGFYPANREKFTTRGTRVHWFVVSWEESRMPWKNFRSDFIGATNPKEAAEGSLRQVIARDWKVLGLKESPNVSDNGVHASAGPIEGLAERRIWLQSDVVDDPLGVKLLFAGVPSDVIHNLLRNPELSLPSISPAGGDSHASRNGRIFDLLEDTQSSASVAVIRAALNAVEAALHRNHAFLFIKPHAAESKPVRQLVEQLLDEAKIQIDDSGVIASERIYDERLIDQHYRVISRFALDKDPSRLELGDTAMMKFETEFGVPWSIALAAGNVLNAQSAVSRFSLKGLAKRWKESTKVVKLLPGLYIGRIVESVCAATPPTPASNEPGSEGEAAARLLMMSQTEEPPQVYYIVNGFYPTIRDTFTSPGKRIVYFSVSWNASELSWKQFRSHVIGSTNPEKAEAGSIRRKMLDEWRELSLISQPNTSENGVHASAGPLEALAERRVWMSGSSSNNNAQHDPFGGPLVTLGMDESVLATLLENPVVSLKGRVDPVFDLMEDMDSADAASSALDLQSFLQQEAAAKGAGASQKNEADAKDTAGIAAVSTFRPRNTAFVFIKPHAVTSGVMALLEVVFKENRIRVEMQGDMTSDEIFNRRIIDRHYATIYRYAEEWTAGKVKLTDHGANIFEDTFKVSWKTAVADHLVFNATDAAKMLKLTPEALGHRWDAALTKAKIAPGLYIARFLEEDIYVMNGFYLRNREAYMAPSARVHWYVVSFAEQDTTWKDFREKIVGPTNPERALADTIRGTIFREYRALGLRTQPDTSNNGIHASAGPLEGFAERVIWLESDLTRDPFGKLALERGCSAVVLQLWAANPYVIIPTNTIIMSSSSQLPPPGTSGYAFDLLEDVQTTDAIQVLVAAEKERRAAPPVNSAFVFVKPQAINRYVFALVEAALRENRIEIVQEGEIMSEDIASKGLIDRHYSTIARYALTMHPGHLPVSEAAQMKFRDVYGVSWVECIANNIVFNAVQALDVLGKITPEELNRRWSIYVNRVKLAPGLYVTEFTDDGIYVINGFYPLAREVYLQPKQRIHYYVVSWREADLTWKDFREKIIGATDPTRAVPSSIRATILRQWEGIGLEREPNVSENAVHASAGPLEGLAERMVWLSARLEDDSFGRALVNNGCDAELVADWTANNPPVVLPTLLPPNTGAPSTPQKGTALTASSCVFDQLEDLQASQVIAILREASKVFGKVGGSTKAPKSSGSSGTTGNGQQGGEISEGERLKHTNCAFVFVKPAACTKEVIATAESAFLVNGMHVEAAGDVYSYDMERLGIIDRHYASISNSAMIWKATKYRLSDEQKRTFREGFGGAEWDVMVQESRILNAVDAAFSLGHLSPTQLMQRWILAKQRVKLAPGFFVAYFEDDDIYVINGFYLKNREKYIDQGARVRWYVVSWHENHLSWKHFRENVIGCAKPSDAADGSLRNAIYRNWRELGLEQAPNVSDNGVHASASPLEALRERLIWLRDATSYETDLFGRALVLAGCDKSLVLETWGENKLVKIGETEGYAFELLEDKQASETVNILSDASSDLTLAPLRHVQVAPKRKLFQASIRDRFINAVTEDELRELFSLYDPEDTGLIDTVSFRDEFVAMENFGLTMDRRMVDRLFAKCDKQQTGKLNLEEFLMIMMARQRL